MSASQPRHQFTVDEVLQMAHRGTLPDVRVQLIEGDLVEMTPQGPAHAGLVATLNRLLIRAYPEDKFCVRPAAPLLLPGVTSTLPEPDFAIIRGTDREFHQRHPRGDEAVLVIEVANTSLSLDRGKADQYAAAGVPEYWIMDVVARHVYRHSELRNQGGTLGYAVPLIVAQVLNLPATPHTVRVSDLF